MKISLIMLLLAMLPLAGQAAPPALEDQLGRSVSLDDYQGQAVLAIVVSGRKLRHIQRWEEALRAEQPALQSIRVADIQDTPRPDLAQVAAKLQKRVPPEASVLIDLDNQWAQAYKLDTNEPCLLLFSPDHELVAEFRGRANKQRLAEVLAAIAPYFPTPTAVPADAG